MIEFTIEQNLTRDVLGLEVGTRMMDSEAEATYVPANSFNNMAVKMFYSLFSGKWWHWLAKVYDEGQTRIETPVNYGYSTGSPWTLGTTGSAHLMLRFAVTGATTTNPVTITIADPGSYETHFAKVGSWVQVSGMSGLVEANGFWQIAAYNTTTNVVTLSGCVPGATAFDNTGADEYCLLYVDGTSQATAGFSSEELRDGPSGVAFKYPNIFVGGSSKAIGKNEYGLGNTIWHGTGNGELTYSSILISEPAVALATSTITLTQTYTNNGADMRDVQIKEAALWTLFYYVNSNAYYARGQIARDTVTTTCLYGATVEVSYRFNTHCTTTGGFVRQFNELLYRHLANTSREAKTTSNQNVLETATNTTFYLAGPTSGGGSIPFISGQTGANPRASDYGLMVGASSQIVDFEDYALISRVEHGISDGQLYHTGTAVDFITQNSTTCTFDVFRYFHNYGATTVTIKEMGLYCAKDKDYTSIHMICRHLIPTVGTGFDIPPGEVAKITYRLSS